MRPKHSLFRVPWTPHRWAALGAKQNAPRQRGRGGEGRLPPLGAQDPPPSPPPPSVCLCHVVSLTRERQRLQHRRKHQDPRRYPAAEPTAIAGGFGLRHLLTRPGEVAPSGPPLGLLRRWPGRTGVIDGDCARRGRRALRPTEGIPAGQFARFSGLWRIGKEPLTKLGRDQPRTTVRPRCGANHPGHRTGAHNTRGNHTGARNAHVRHTQRWCNWAYTRPAARGGRWWTTRWTTRTTCGGV